MSPTTVIAVIGQNGSGKDEVVKYLNCCTSQILNNIECSKSK